MDFNFLSTYLPYLLDGLAVTIQLAAISLVGSLALGTVLAMMRLSPFWWIRWPAILYVDTVRMVPLIMVIFWFFFLLPILIGQPVAAMVAALAALIAFNASYMAEVIRSGIQSVPRGLAEAARCSGLSYGQCMRHVVLPIAIRNILPALINRLVALFMGTSLTYIIGVTEFFRAATNINNRIFRPYEIFLFVALVYFAFCYSLSLFGGYLERRLAVDKSPERRH
jgi:His/Glu/Gln/Arg/opine family amino acid ABC transporter permease subunit